MTAIRDRLKLRPAIVAVALGLVAVLALRPAAADPAIFVQGVGDEVVGILEQTDAPQEKRLQELTEILDRAADLDLIARLVLGRHWKTINDAQRREFQALFREFVLATLAARLNEAGGETFTITGSREAGKNDTLVATEIHRPGQPQPLKVDWRVRSDDASDAIIDVVVEGVSMVVTQRSDFAAAIERKGFDGFLEELRGRIEGRA